MSVNGRDLVLLSSSAERGYLSHIDLTNPDLFEGDVLCAPQQTINVRRVRAIYGDLFERIRIKNYNPFDVTLEVRLTFGADFADIFDVRGMTHRHSGGSHPPTVKDSTIEFVHEGRDHAAADHQDPLRRRARAHRRRGGARHGGLPAPPRPVPDPARRGRDRAGPGDRTDERGPGLRPRGPRAPSLVRGVGAGVDADRHRQRGVQPAPGPQPARPARAVHAGGGRRRSSPPGSRGT